MAKRRKKSQGSVNAKADTRTRIQHRFWLNANNESELQLIHDLKHFKSQRKYARLIRDALRLIFSLLLGDTSVLVELFPHIVASIQNDARADLLMQNEALRERVGQLEGELEASVSILLKPQLDRMERMMLQQQKPVIQDPPQMSDNQGVTIGLRTLQPGFEGNVGPRILNVAVAGPDFSDDDSDSENLLIVKKDESSAARATANFLKSVLSLNEDNPDKPKPDLKALSTRQKAYMEGDKQNGEL